MFKFSGSSYLSSAQIIAWCSAAEKTCEDDANKMISPSSRLSESPRLLSWLTGRWLAFEERLNSLLSHSHCPHTLDVCDVFVSESEPGMLQ